MKNFVALVLLCASVAGFAQEIDFSGLSYDQPSTKRGIPSNISMIDERSLADLAEYQTARQNPVWCPTDSMWMERRGNRDTKMGCPTEGGCDDPVTRDATSTAPMDVRIYVHVMRNTNGTGGITANQARATIQQVINDYAGTGINIVVAGGRFVNDSNYATIPAYSPFNNNWVNAIDGMKNQYAVAPANVCNIFISGQASSPWGTLLGIATFPWDPVATTKLGGLWLNNIATGSGAKTAAHELGHCFGLWHTHHGVSEVASCSNCYEYASGVQGDIRGDFCSDTPPTPTNYNCSGPGGSDCQGTPWGATQPENLMGYGPDTCINLFTPQQTSRMHCWINDALPGWIQ